MSTIIKTKAIVLNKLDFGDTSKIVNVFSKDLGRIAGIIKGARSTNSKLGKTIDLLNIVELVFYIKENRDIQVITQADLHSHFPNIKSDLDKLKYSSAIVELILKLTVENDPHIRLFNGVEKILQRIETEETSPLLLFAYFYKFFLGEIGYGFETDNCAGCNKVLVDSEKIYYNYELGLMCDSCGKNHLISFSFSSELFSKIICLSQRKKPCSYKNGELESIITFFEKFLIYQIDEYKGLKSLQMY